MKSCDRDCVFVHPNGAKAIYQDLGHEIKAIEPPIWAGLLANHTRKYGYRVDLIDAEAMNYSLDETVEEIHLRKPRLIVVVVYGLQPSASTQTMHAAELLCQKLKQLHPEYKILLVGGHVSALPRETMQSGYADFVCQGEGPRTICGLLASDHSSTLQLQKVPDLWFSDEDHQVQFTFKAPLIKQEELATVLPGQSWDLLPMEKYRAHNWHCFDHLSNRTPYASLYTSLGCPYRCSFCCINAPFGKSSFRFWDPEFIMQQIDHLVQVYHIKNFKFADEMFVLKEEHFLKICELLIKRNYDLNIWAYTRVDTVKERHLDLLRKAGVRWLVVGIESAGQNVRDGVHKGRFTQEHIMLSIQRMKNAGIHVLGNFIFGLPDDNFQSMQHTLDMALELNCEFANFYSAMAYPGSALFTMAKEKNWELPPSWIGYSQHSYETLPLKTDYLSAGEILGFRDYAWKKYFHSERYQQLVQDKFGPTVYQHIQSTMQIDLKRKHAIPYNPHTPAGHEKIIINERDFLCK